jgi:hypothetical protein
MTTLLPKDQVDVLRSVGDAANVLLALLLIDRLHPGHSTTDVELADILNKDKRTVGSRLKSLCGSNRVIFNGHGYVLLEGGRALILAPAPELPDEVESPNEWGDVVFLETLSPDVSAPAQSDGLADRPQSREEIRQAHPPIQKETPDAPEPPEMPPMDLADAHFVQGTREEPTRALRAPLEEEVNLINQESLSLDSSSSINNGLTAQNVRVARKTGYQPSTLEILQATGALFDKAVTVHGIADRPRRLAIGWVAQAWDQRRNLKVPQGLIYSRLKAGHKPEQKYYDRPGDYLPEHYLVQLGVLVCRPVEPEESEPEDVTVIVKAANVDPVDGILDSAVGPHCWRSPRQVWEAALDQLREEIHVGPFNTWVKDTRPMRFDGSTLTIGAKSIDGCEWLESRVRSTAERLLVGIMNQSVKVAFVVDYPRSEE